MTGLDIILRAVFLNKPELYKEVKKKMCHHEGETFIDDGFIICSECEADIGFHEYERDYDSEIKDEAVMKSQE